MLKHNKAQRDCIYRWIDGRENKLSRYSKVEAFLDEFLAIEDTPDPERFVIRCTDPVATPPCSFELFETFDQADIWLNKLLQTYVPLVKTYIEGDRLEVTNGLLFEIIPQWKINLDGKD